MALFGGGKTFRPKTDIPSQSGRVFLITGGNTGLGYETIKQLAVHNPAAIYLAARTPSKAEAAIEALKKIQPDANIVYLPLDLSSMESVAAAAKEFATKSPRLDVLINNAGIMATPLSDTKEGYEIQFGTNHMGHALLTKLLLPTLQATAKEPNSDVRIVNLTSEGHNFARTPSALLSQAEIRKCGAWTRYGYSKLANIIFTRGLAERYPEITSVAVHPGVIKTDLYIPSATTNPIIRYGTALSARFMSTIESGTLNQLWAATGPKASVVSGTYYTPVGKASKGSPCARNAQLPTQLWEWTEKELAEKGY